MPPLIPKKAPVQSKLQGDFNTFAVSFSDAEAQVIRSKARKAGISINEYIRHAALGFPVN